MSLLPRNFLDATHKYSRHIGGHLALQVFWARGSSQEINVWEASSTLEVGSGMLSALGTTLPFPAPPLWAVI